MTEREYNDCVTTYADNVYRFILKNLRHEEDARDVVQTAFEKMWRNREGVAQCVVRPMPHCNEPVPDPYVQRILIVQGGL